MKTCIKCKETKELSAFLFRKRTQTYLGRCKKCTYAVANAYRLKNRDADLENKKEYYQKNKHRLYAINQEWNKNNPDRTKHYKKSWKNKNRGKVNADWMKRHAAKKQRTPKWLTETHFQQIEIFYDAAHKLTQEFGIPMHVDHITPLQGKNSSGLHVPWNLQVIPAVENCKKGNRI